jgi:hypothetical protein
MARRVIVVLGMHRSGTSLLARLLQGLGVPLGSRLLTRAEPDNPYGYWEQRDIAMQQDFLLATLGRMWHEPRGVLDLPHGWLDSAAARTAETALTAIVRQELAAAHGLWGFKDPRTLRFLPLWQRIFTSCAAVPVYILAIRRPASVAGSLARRNQLSASHARFLWTQHNLAPFRTPGIRLAAIVDYDSWFEHPQRNMRRILRAIGSRQPPRAALERCLGLLDRDARHHAEGAGSMLADRIYALLNVPMPASLRAYRLRLLARRIGEAEQLLEAWQEMIERCHPAGPLPVEAWKE